MAKLKHVELNGITLVVAGLGSSPQLPLETLRNTCLIQDTVLEHTPRVSLLPYTVMYKVGFVLLCFPTFQYYKFFLSRKALLRSSSSPPMPLLPLYLLNLCLTTGNELRARAVRKEVWGFSGLAPSSVQLLQLV